MQPKSNKEKLQFVGGAIVVIAAFIIMMPGLLGIIMGMGRVLLYISTILLLGGAVAFVLRKVRGVKSPGTRDTNAQSATTVSDADETSRN